MRCLPCHHLSDGVALSQVSVARTQCFGIPSVEWTTENDDDPRPRQLAQHHADHPPRTGCDHHAPQRRPLAGPCLP
uniref:Uncharacterized protein n=1 Tax=uncultured marine virus TaxID=186617 RepID=A0A0F7L7T1_9VIRU|nr:hypothetical protein [uncultured marine virus]